MSTDAHRKCAKCGATAFQDGVTSLHRFPKLGKTNIKRARAWAQFCWPEQDWTSLAALTRLYKSNKVLCKRHFKDICFTDNTKSQLGRFSVPTESRDAVSFQPSINKSSSITLATTMLRCPTLEQSSSEPNITVDRQTNNSDNELQCITSHAEGKCSDSRSDLDNDLLAFMSEIKSIISDFKDQQNENMVKIFETVEKIKMQNIDIQTSTTFLSQNYQSLKNQIDKLQADCNSNLIHI
ncbi:uncharacterized protein LOC113513083 [Galleria mellonella]|uniref:Uncharacterized protein LOC113513083 n=1 Tax=Galleria mellonella TaxID=7137 RepID=A0A6J1WGV0_GALME|nr:uncharacterized protein LOC113513083 [Galleria mellonella]